MNTENRAYDFSLRVAEIVRYLKKERREFPMGDKLLDCAVSAGIFARNGDRNAAAGCIEQVDYIIEMASRAGYLTEYQTEPIRRDGSELITMLRA